MKILVLRFSSIGDIVLTSPVVRCLKKKYADAEIHYATKAAFKSIVENNPYVSKVHVLKGSLNELIAELRGERFDYIIDLHHNQRTLFIKWRLGVKSYSFNKINFEKWLMVNFKINRLPNQHIVDRYLQTCAALGVENDGGGLDYFIKNDEVVSLASLPPAFQNGYIGWVIGAKQNTKKFPTEKIITALRQIHQPVILLGGKEDNAEAETIIAALPEKTIYNACGKYSLNQSASLVQQATKIITNDTGLMHIAAAFKKPIISLWGNTIPQFGMYPYYGKAPIENTQLELKNLSCRPCSKLGYAKCPEGHFKCMKEIDEGEILKALHYRFTV